MAHFAELGTDNIVLRVIAVSNPATAESDGTEKESIGADFCRSLLGGTWKQASYNAKIRKNFAGVGYTYDSSRNAFIGPKPYSSWVLDEDTCQWGAPVSYPSDGKGYDWDESTKSWKEKT